MPAPRALPPAGSDPVVYLIAPCFEAQGNISLIDVQTYLYYIQLKASRPSEGVWIAVRRSGRARPSCDDFKRLWGTNFLDNISIDVRDYTFSNGVIGKLVIYNLEERQRVKIVDYTGSKKVETTKIDEKLKEANAQIRLDTFIDPGLVKKVESIVRDLMKEKGFQFAERHARDQGNAGRPQAGAPHLHDGRGAEGQDPQDRLRRQPGDQRRRAQAPDEGEQAGSGSCPS